MSGGTASGGAVSIDTWQTGFDPVISSGTALFSPDRLHRYVLTRRWGGHDPFVMFVGLNPSTADARLDDPTIRRCVQFAKDWGFGHLIMTNAFAFRATKPKDMLAAADPIGTLNDRYLTEMGARAGLVIACWGAHCGAVRAREVLKLLPAVQCLGTNDDGSPKHPLYLRKDTKPKPYSLP